MATTLIDKAQLLAAMSENARADGNITASIELAIQAAQLLQLAKLLSPPEVGWIRQSK